MTTVTLKINGKTTAGKLLQEMIELLSKETKGVQVIKDFESPYNPKFVSKIKKAQKDIATGKTITIETNSIWDSI